MSKETLGDQIKEARLSKKLVNHPVCLTAEGGVSFEMEKYMQAVQPEMGVKAERVLELNASPALSRRWKRRWMPGDKDKAADYIRIFFLPRPS